MNQTMFDVPDPLVMHVMLLKHEFMYNIFLIDLLIYLVIVGTYRLSNNARLEALVIQIKLMFNAICLPYSWYPHCDSPCFPCAQNTQIVPLL